MAAGDGKGRVAPQLVRVRQGSPPPPTRLRRSSPCTGVMPVAVPGVSPHVMVLPSLWLVTDAEPCERDTVEHPPRPPAKQPRLSLGSLRCCSTSRSTTSILGPPQCECRAHLAGALAARCTTHLPCHTNHAGAECLARRSCQRNARAQLPACNSLRQSYAPEEPLTAGTAGRADSGIVSVVSAASDRRNWSISSRSESPGTTSGACVASPSSSALPVSTTSAATRALRPCAVLAPETSRAQLEVEMQRW